MILICETKYEYEKLFSYYLSWKNYHGHLLHINNETEDDYYLGPEYEFKRVIMNKHIHNGEVVVYLKKENG